MNLASPEAVPVAAPEAFLSQAEARPAQEALFTKCHIKYPLFDNLDGSCELFDKLLGVAQNLGDTQGWDKAFRLPYWSTFANISPLAEVDSEDLTEVRDIV